MGSGSSRSPPSTTTSCWWIAGASEPRSRRFSPHCATAEQRPGSRRRVCNRPMISTANLRASMTSEPLAPSPSPGGGGSASAASRGGVSSVTSPTSINKFRRAAARRLRSGQTGAEKSLWREPRKLELKGTHFRRQVPIGNYVADFACLASRLIIELDGSQHGEEPTKGRDQARTYWLELEGYRVLRFWNNDLSENLDGVMETIYAALYGSREAEPIPLKHERRLKDHPTPARCARRPSPSRGG
jgi:very-short-patch-repair endonuclease